MVSLLVSLFTEKSLKREQLCISYRENSDRTFQNYLINTLPYGSNSHATVNTSLQTKVYRFVIEVF